jgi:hypothetical protein
MLANMVKGHDFVRNEIGSDKKIKIAWQLDPFGHSNTNAYLLTKMGYEALFFARQD